MSTMSSTVMSTSKGLGQRSHHPAKGVVLKTTRVLRDGPEATVGGALVTVPAQKLTVVVEVRPQDAVT